MLTSMSAAQAAERSSELAIFTSRMTGENRLPLVITGPAGFGKTTVVTAFEDLARTHNWRVISETASKGAYSRLTGTYLPALWDSLQDSSGSSSEKNFETLCLTEQLEMLLDALEELGAGLLITFDDFQKSSVKELKELFVFAEKTREANQPLQIVVAGRPTDMRDVLAQFEASYLNAGERVDLCSFNREQTEAAFKEAYVRSNRDLASDALAMMCAATKGHPHMVRLLSKFLLDSCGHPPTEHEIEQGAKAATEVLDSTVFEPMLTEFSAGDRAFLEAMSVDDGPSKMSDIAARLGKNPQYAGVYRNRLVEAHIIRAASYGKVTFAIPHLREYLRRKAEQPSGFDF